jgi:hypothetical protein
VPFFTADNDSGGRPRKTTPDDDNLLKEVVLQNKWSSVNEIKELPAIKENEKLSNIATKTIYKRLSQMSI